ncbi:acetyl-CoA carboxylase biotin carboxylase subunit [Caballeronia sordidicola]|uniref:biotin carboxylase n=1 Tax=Caballeronia sordidicola TaxID=196367 RepID=A0A158EQD6_CABSO|nr:acetyl-CoA carboxylase biotin carboxylase subunit [Caballeronia sordidicola]SAL08880.1 acetyl-CoA carboxylase biotin carboxylase subunit [Caballeronia sordidicola]
MTRAIRKVFIANRGEIAVRIIRAARELGLQTVLGCSEADADSLAARMADGVEVLGPAPAAKSYLDTRAVVDAALRSGADAVHPGYGFLSENAAFAQALKDAGLIFVGPSPETISLMGDKAAARACARRAGVPTVPGSDGVVEHVGEAQREALKVGYPVMLKAAAGGGGRGIRVAQDADELAAEFDKATREAESAFGYGGLYLERFVGRAHHVEVQIMGDGVRAIHLYDRECSLQRRRQKLMEEAPSPSLDDEVRGRLCASAVALAESVGYVGVGTIEYLFDATTSEFFFIEMNTRVQVEHPVTEMVTGIDIVRESLRLATGEALGFAQEDIVLRGAAIECRINAEDPVRNFMPSPGVIGNVRLPGGPGVRTDTHIFDGYRVPPFYDSLLGKVIAWDVNRDAAISRMKRALTELHVDGVKTTRALHLALLDDPGVAAGVYETSYLEENIERIIQAIA